jgi:predicted Fe-Mo cluster-binding NifX family protein
MRVAVPTYEQSIAPRLDCARSFLVVDGSAPFDRQGHLRAKEIAVPAEQAWAWLHALRDEGVEVLLCGGVRRRDLYALLSQGVTVYADLSGGIVEVLTQYRDGALSMTREQPRMGCGGRRQGGEGEGNGEGDGFRNENRASCAGHTRKGR